MPASTSCLADGVRQIPLRKVGGKRTQAKEKSQALSAPEPLSKGAANQLM